MSDNNYFQGAFEAENSKAVCGCHFSKTDGGSSGGADGLPQRHMCCSNTFVSGVRRWHCPSKEAVEQLASPLGGGPVLTTALAVQVASAEGVMYTLTVPQLQLLSWTSVFPSSPTSLLCSPDSQWVFASTQDSDLGPKVSGGLCPLLQRLALFMQGGGFCTQAHGCVWGGGFQGRTKLAGSTGTFRQDGPGPEESPGTDFEVCRTGIQSKTLAAKATSVTYAAQNHQSR